MKEDTSSRMFSRKIEAFMWIFDVENNNEIKFSSQVLDVIDFIMYL
jgi:hypothetical protein